MAWHGMIAWYQSGWIIYFSNDLKSLWDLNLGPAQMSKVTHPFPSSMQQWSAAPCCERSLRVKHSPQRIASPRARFTSCYRLVEASSKGSEARQQRGWRDILGTVFRMVGIRSEIGLCSECSVGVDMERRGEAMVCIARRSSNCCSLLVGWEVRNGMWRQCLVVWCDMLTHNLKVENTQSSC